MKRVNYNEVAAVYDQRYRTGGPTGIAECLQELVHEVEANRVLEAGCGTGHWLTTINNCEFRVGLDFSAGMLDRARQRDAALALTQGTATQLPFCKNAFDLVFCVHALHHFDDPPAFITEAYRVLRRGGALAIIGMDPQTEQDRWYVYDYFPGTYETDLERYPSGDQILRWMKEAGFIKYERHLAARIVHEFTGYEVFDDPILQKNGTSQLSLLPKDEFLEGMARIRKALQRAARNGEELTFQTDINLPAVIGFVSE